MQDIEWKNPGSGYFGLDYPGMLLRQQFVEPFSFRGRQYRLSAIERNPNDCLLMKLSDILAWLGIFVGEAL